MRHTDRIRRLSNAERNWIFFLAASVFLGITTGLYETSFNNYLSDVFRISSRTRGMLEFPREFPGCSIALVSAVLAFVPEVKIAVAAVALWVLGLVGIGLLSPNLPILVVWMMTLSVGMHLYLPLNQSIGVSVTGGEQVGSRLGQLGGANTAATIVGAGAVWLGTRFLGLGYSGIFVTAAATTLLAAVCLVLMRMAPRSKTAMTTKFVTRFVVKRRYALFYALSVLFGARKQVFITFAPWAIVRVFHQPASTIAMLWIVSSVLGIAFKPLLGRLVDSWGERKILMAEAAILILVCLGYASAGGSTPAGISLGLYLVYACFVADQLLMAVGIARTTYLHKIAETPEDFTPTLALGVSLDHVVSMGVPALGGMLWAAMGYRYVFVATAVIALVNLVVAAQISLPETRKAAVAGRAVAPCVDGPR